MLQTCNVSLAHVSYPIYIDVDLLTQHNLLENQIVGQQVLIVSNQTIAAIYLERIQKTLTNKKCDVIIVPDGEQYKTLTTLSLIFDQLLQKKHTRKTTLIALGGGVIGDITGFAAACYMRGVDYIQIPTTLLAQVDSAIGGKTAVNHELGKNMIGAFHQPRAVFVDITTLNTLPEREFRSGLAEIVKYGLIQDKNFFNWLEQHWLELLQKQPKILQYAILRSCEIKAEIVAADEREQNIRALLNLGHTFAHAIETGLGYGEWLHGEAVAIGLLLAADLSQQLKWLTNDEVNRIKNLLIQAQLPIVLPKKLTSDYLLELMTLDKKNINQNLRLVLLSAIGEALISEQVSLETIKITVNKYYEP